MPASRRHGEPSAVVGTFGSPRHHAGAKSYRRGYRNQRPGKARAEPKCGGIRAPLDTQSAAEEYPPSNGGEVPSGWASTRRERAARGRIVEGDMRRTDGSMPDGPAGWRRVIIAVVMVLGAASVTPASTTSTMGSTARTTPAAWRIPVVIRPVASAPRWARPEPRVVRCVARACGLPTARPPSTVRFCGSTPPPVPVCRATRSTPHPTSRSSPSSYSPGSRGSGAGRPCYEGASPQTTTTPVS